MDVTREITLPVDPQVAWEAITDLERWLTDDGSLELEPGAAGELTLRDGETRWATVEEVRVGEHLSFWWHAPDALADARRGRPRRRLGRHAGRRRRERLRRPAGLRLALGRRRELRPARRAAPPRRPPRPASRSAAPTC